MGVITLVPLGKFKPRLEVKANIINKLALEPLFVNIPYSLPNNLANKSSNCLAWAYPKTL